MSSPNSTSVASVRSWASSNIMTEYLDSSGSVIASRRSMPSVMNLITVLGLEHSSKRIE